MVKLKHVERFTAQKVIASTAAVVASVEHEYDKHGSPNRHRVAETLGLAGNITLMLLRREEKAGTIVGGSWLE